MDIKSGEEANGRVIARIATMVAYDMTDEEIVSTVEVTVHTPTRWVAFMAKAIRTGRYTPTARVNL